MYSKSGVVAAISVTVFVVGPYVVRLLYGAQLEPTIDVLRWMAFVPLMSGLTDIFRVQTMLPLGMKAQYSAAC